MPRRLRLVHNFTLIDDIEDDSTRATAAGAWRVAGVPNINAGDGMFVLARRTLLDMAAAGVPPVRVLDAAHLLDDACVALCEGQYADIGFESRADVSLREYEAMIAGKTAALLGASAAIGAIAADADAATVAAIGECGRLRGLAFQVQDDVLGIWGEADVTGKPVADDIRSRKKSFPVVYAFERLGAAPLDELRTIYASPQVSDDAVEPVLALLEQAGGGRAAAAAAERWASAALGRSRRCARRGAAAATSRRSRRSSCIARRNAVARRTGT
jgi:geranylgeranyl diphosphate synthase type I